MEATRPRKRFGQHFLHDANILAKIVAAIAPGPEQRLVEIGPGRGALTARLIDSVEHLDVIEIDRDLAAALPGIIKSENLTIHAADALQFDFAALRIDQRPLRLVGNLPYNISTPLLFHLLAYGSLFADLHAMVQKEVALRMTAKPGNKTYGRLSVAVAARCSVETLFHIRPGSFTPAPKVDSSLIRLVPEPDKLARIDSEPLFDAIVRAAFGKRRKRLSNALDGMLSAEQIASVDIDPGNRAEQLDVEQFVALGNLCRRLNIQPQSG